MKQAFSLVELSIVLVILGLLTGGILTGQSLIRASELRAVTTEFQQWQTAVNTFKGKYFALPGDMTNATDFWGSATGASCVHGQMASGSGTETCNGTGNGRMNTDGGNPYEYVEMFMFWQHLANAGMIKGSDLSGRAGNQRSTSVLGWNVPASNLSGAVWTLHDNLFEDHVPNGLSGTYGYDHSGWPLIIAAPQGS